jgi:hypothetical protein
MKLIIIALLVICLSGCAAGYWTKDNFDLREWEKDNYECDYQATLATSHIQGILGVTSYFSWYGKCLTSRGYHKMK